MPPVQAELELIEPILKSMGGFVKKPNMVLTVYKGRGSRYPKGTKIWQYICLGTMRAEDLFCTDKDYNPITVERTFVNMLDKDEAIKTTNLEQIGDNLIDKDTGEIIEGTDTNKTKKKDVKF